jgi:cytochrome b involved in lipid metabolism
VLCCARQQGAGIDSTELFDDVGHSDEATGMLKQYYIGELSD